MKPHQTRKRFGQHFLRSSEVLQQIVDAIQPKAPDHLVEIGAGEGVLTRLLLPHCQQLDSIEIDNDLVPRLKKEFQRNSHFFIHHQDVLTFELSSLNTPNKHLRIVGNLPYNISSPLLFRLFNEIHRIQDMHFLLQKEVVLRMTAAVGSKNYNRLSVMTQYFCENLLLFDVDRSAFSPPPKVDSSVVRMIPRTPSLIANNVSKLSDVVKTAFTHRRKTLKNCFKELIPEETLLKLDINPQSRPQELAVSDFVKISNQLNFA